MGWDREVCPFQFRNFLSSTNLQSAHLGHTQCYTVSSTMAISKELLEILVCPLCKATVELKQDENGLKCVECKRVYPIRDDIPVMLVDEARFDSPQESPSGSADRRRGRKPL